MTCHHPHQEELYLKLDGNSRYRIADFGTDAWWVKDGNGRFRINDSFQDSGRMIRDFGSRVRVAIR